MPEGELSSWLLAILQMGLTLAGAVFLGHFFLRGRSPVSFNLAMGFLALGYVASGINSDSPTNYRGWFSLLFAFAAGYFFAAAERGIRKK